MSSRAPAEGPAVSPAHEQIRRFVVGRLFKPRAVLNRAEVGERQSCLSPIFASSRVFEYCPGLIQEAELRRL